MKKNILFLVMLCLFNPITFGTESNQTTQQEIQDGKSLAKKNLEKMLITKDKIPNNTVYFSYELGDRFDPDIFRDKINQLKKNGQKVIFVYDSYLKMMIENKKKGKEKVCTAAKELMEITHLQEVDYVLLKDDEKLLEYYANILDLMDAEPDLIDILVEKKI